MPLMHGRSGSHFHWVLMVRSCNEALLFLDQDGTEASSHEGGKFNMILDLKFLIANRKKLLPAFSPKSRRSIVRMGGY